MTRAVSFLFLPEVLILGAYQLAFLIPRIFRFWGIFRHSVIPCFRIWGNFLPFRLAAIPSFRMKDSFLQSRHILGQRDQMFHTLQQNPKILVPV